MSILEQVNAFLESDKSDAYPIKIEDGFLLYSNIHWPYFEPYFVAGGKAIILESDKQGSIKKGNGKTDIKGLLDRNGFTRPKAVIFREIEGALIYQEDEVDNNSEASEGGEHND